MLEKLEQIKSLIGRTPLHLTDIMGIKLGIKLEYHNLSGSIKDRSAFNIIYEGVKNNEITPDTTIVESSSGNFAIALANICNYLGLRFIPVVDQNINQGYLQLLKVLCNKIVLIKEKDETGGYLLNRLKKVKEICSETPDSFWTNQYGNPNNYLAYYNGLANEILEEAKELTHLFVAVSSGGTLAGLSRRIKEANSNIRIIAVDIEGSVIFDRTARSRYISGLGSSIVPPLLSMACFDEVMYVSHEEIVAGCKALYNDSLIFGGGSAGATYQAFRKYFGDNPRLRNVSAVMCCPDRGNAYIDTIYDKQWISKIPKPHKYAVLK